jgi:hypothetical protein
MATISAPMLPIARYNCAMTPDGIGAAGVELVVGQADELTDQVDELYDDDDTFVDAEEVDHEVVDNDDHIDDVEVVGLGVCEVLEGIHLVVDVVGSPLPYTHDP